jgi:hypothetical protein
VASILAIAAVVGITIVACTPAREAAQASAWP